MWTRKELKDKAKVSFKANYWKSVLVALVLMALIGGMSFYSSMSSVPATLTSGRMHATSYEPSNVNVEIKDGKVKVDVDDDDGGKVHVDLDADDVEELGEVLDHVNVDGKDLGSLALVGPGMVFAGLSMATLMLIVMAIVVALYVFIFSPLEVGAQRFFVRNLNQRAEVKELAFGYDNNYKEVVKTIFLRWLFVFLWGLLLIIPGIYKSYEYRMIPYLLAEDPTMTKDRAFAESKRMMYGHKWNTFVLDLSFLGWNILSFFTLGILGVFYVAPYQAQTNAALYEKLRYGLPAPTPNAQATPYAGAPVPPDAQNAPYTGAQTPYAGSYSAPVSSATPAAYDAPAASAAYSAPAAVVPAPAAPPAYSAPEMVAPEPVPNANDQVQAVPVIVSESQPPIPPFAQVGGEIEDDVDPTAELFESDAEPMVEPSEDDVEPTATIPEINSATTAALPEVGVDPTKQFPAAAENDEASDSPEA